MGPYRLRCKWTGEGGGAQQWDNSEAMPLPAPWLGSGNQQQPVVCSENERGKEEKEEEKVCVGSG